MPSRKTEGRLWRLIESGEGDAALNMAIDEAIAVCVRQKKSSPTLRLYGWYRPSVTIGCFQDAAEIDLAYCRDHAIPVVRRPTGGRAILHHRELTYSFASSLDEQPFGHGLLDSYARIAEAFRRAFTKLGIRAEPKPRREKRNELVKSSLCFHATSFAEIVVDNRKLVGSAQRRWSDGLLQQGSLPYSCDEVQMGHIFGSNVVDALRFRMTTLDAVATTDSAAVAKAVISGFEDAFGVSLRPEPLRNEEMVLALQLADRKYRQDAWNLHPRRPARPQPLRATDNR